MSFGISLHFGEGSTMFLMGETFRKHYHKTRVVPISLLKNEIIRFEILNVVFGVGFYIP